MMRTNKFWGITTIVMALLGQAHAQPFLTNGLVAYYPLHGNANDASSNGLNGAAADVSYTTNRFGVTSNAVAFAGNSSSRITINSTNFNFASNFTATMWINPLAGFNTSRLFSTSGYETGIQGQTPYVAEWGFSGILSANALSANSWVQLVTVCNGTQFLVYVNGILTGSGALSQPLSYTTTSPTLGVKCTDGSSDFQGQMSDVRFYNVAFTSNQVAQLYALDTIAPPCTPHSATATAMVVNKFFVGGNITDEGCGYTNTPLVVIQGGGGSGAAATAQLSNGQVTNINVLATGSNYTSTPTIFIGFPPTITVEPQPVLVNAFNPATFSVTPAPTTGPVTYQWSLNSTNIAGATGSSFAISSVVQTNLGNYSVVVTSPFGSIASSNAMLSMNPIIVTPFTGEVTIWGKDAMLSVVAWGTGPLTYQWFDNGSAVAGATGATLDISSIQFTNAGVYSVVVTSPLKSVTNSPEQVVVEPAGFSIGFSPALTISGVAGQTYIIQSSPSLSGTNTWTTLTNLTLTQPVQIFVDTNVDASSPFYQKYFYRILPGP